MIRVENVSFAYPGKEVIFQSFSWQVEKGESWAIIGPSGCGKTTLLYLLAGLRLPQEGTVLVNDQVVRRPRRQTGLILQDYGLLPWATVHQNTALGLTLRGVREPQRQAIVTQWLARLDIAGVSAQYPSQLSGGQRQRAAVARTLALEPDLLLMDEPFSSLDALTREGLQNMVIELGIESILTSVLVTHSIEEAVFLGKRILVLPLPPITQGTVIDNPLAGQLRYRGQPEFYRTCERVRQTVERVGHDGQG